MRGRTQAAAKLVPSRSTAMTSDIASTVFRCYALDHHPYILYDCIYTSEPRSYSQYWDPCKKHVEGSKPRLVEDLWRAVLTCIALL